MVRRRDHNMFMWGTIFVVLVVTGLLLWHWHAI
jgi:type II secretory pathway component PulM